MPYIVEIEIDTVNLARRLRDMRSWLDHVKFDAIGFRKTPDTNIWRVDFERAEEARAFAEEFAGEVLNSISV